MAKMRLTYYITASVAAAGGVVLDAFNRRPNFYSATVYLAQTPLCFMILANFIFVCYASIIYGLQRVLFGDLRIIERERLWERGWISVTETLLIMMTFRDDVGAWFLFILANLVVARMWAWLAEGRTEMLEQQPPANPRLFHARQTASLLVSCVANFGFLKYCVDTVLEQARPGMMVMFAFEFAVLTITSFSNLFRYCIALYEIRETHRQTKAKIEARRVELRTERAAAEARITEDPEGSAEARETAARLAREEANIDENDVDVPGWEDKGRWVFGLDIVTDFLRLVVYLAFFSVLMIFHGIPIHIVRDVYVTLHSFLKRIYSFWQYRTATKDMNTRFPDATAEELQRESTCIVCREDMQVWPAEGAPAMEQRLRAKKLPCGHILHFGCLRSWLERQQVCPTCRRPVLDNPTGAATAGPAAGRAQPAALPAIPGAQGGHVQPEQPRGADQQRQGNAPDGGQGQRPNPFAQWRPRTLNLGPLRIAYGNMPVEALNALQQGHLNVADGAPAIAAAAQSAPSINERHPPQSSAALELELMQIERELSRQILDLNLHQQQLGLVRMLQSELARLRAMHVPTQTIYQLPAGYSSPPIIHTAGVETNPPAAGLGPSTATQTELPPGMTLPEGWTLIPLTRTELPQQQVWSASASDRGTTATSYASAGPSTSTQQEALQPTPTIPIPSLSAPPTGALSAVRTPAVDQGAAHDVSSPASASDRPTVSTPDIERVSGQAPADTTASEQPTSTSVHGPLQTSMSSVAAPAPTWSFNNATAAATISDGVNGGGRATARHDEPQQQHGIDGAGSSINGTIDKGKGRAATVEDEPEPEPELD